MASPTLFGRGTHMMGNGKSRTSDIVATNNKERNAFAAKLKFLIRM